MNRIAKISCAIFLLFLTGLSSATPVDPASEVIYVLINSKGATASQLDYFGNTGLKNYIQNKLPGVDTSRIYMSSYDMTTGTPADFAKNYLDRASSSSILESALVHWFNGTKDASIRNYGSLENLRSKRPDLVPRIVVVADGAVGLALREYIQSENYKGEISNVLFFNTPHEGTGFADQAILKNSSKLDNGSDNSKYAGLIPLALVAYLAGGIDGLQEFMISLMKDAVMQIAYNAESIRNDFNDNASVFNGYGADNAATWYLAQDADETDSVYMGLIREKGAEKLLGSTQVLNSYSKNNAFMHPSYNVVYSYGLPTIGNGRRTLADFVDQSKNHVSKEKLKQILADSLKSVLKSVDAAEQIDGLASALLNNDNVNAVLKNFEALSDQTKQITSVIEGLSDLRSVKLNKDDIPGSIYKMIRIVDKFIPDSYKSEVYALLSKYYSSEAKELLEKVGDCSIGKKSRKECVVAGLSVLADNLSDYSLNFLDQGTFDVPYYSAIGANVAAFKDAGVERFGYEMNEILEHVDEYKKTFPAYANQLDSLKKYQDL